MEIFLKESRGAGNRQEYPFIFTLELFSEMVVGKTVSDRYLDEVSCFMITHLFTLLSWTIEK